MDLTQIHSSNISNTAYQSALAPYRNRIIGGDFTTNPWQRGTSFIGHAAGYTADRFEVSEASDGVIDINKSADAPGIVEAGVFTQHCLDISVGTTDSSVADNDIVVVKHSIEGGNIADLGFGQPGTRYFTFSFWHKHTKTQTYSVSFRSGSNRCYVAEYTQSVADTWERAEITIPVDTSGTWNYDNGLGLEVLFALHVGSAWQTGTLNTWQAGSFIASTNQVNALDSASNNFKIALVQLEAGEKATPFEALPVDVVLQRCQRYYEAINLLGIGAVRRPYDGLFEVSVQFKTKKRAVPFPPNSVPIANYQPGGATGTATAAYLTTDGCTIRTGSNETNTNYMPNFINRTVNMGFSAEL